MITLPPMHTNDIPLALQLARIREQLVMHREPAVRTTESYERAQQILMAERREAVRERLLRRNLAHAVWMREQRRLKRERTVAMYATLEESKRERA